MVTHKKCKKCGFSKPLERFTPEKLGRLGRRAQCKPCRASMKREVYAENPEKMKASSAKHYYEVIKPRLLKEKLAREAQNEDSLHHRSSVFNWLASLWRVFRDGTIYRALFISDRDGQRNPRSMEPVRPSLCDAGYP